MKPNAPVPNYSLEFDVESHQYRLDGSILPSVTQILQATGMIDAQWYTADAAHRGTVVHEIVQYLEEGVISSSLEAIREANGEVVGYIAAWYAFLDAVDWQGKNSEYRVFSPLNGYAGTVDLYGYLNGKRTIIDIKTGPPQIWHGVQLAAYRFARFYEIAPGQIDWNDGDRLQARNLYLRKDGTFRLVDRQKISRDGHPILYSNPAWRAAWDIQRAFYREAEKCQQ